MRGEVPGEGMMNEEQYRAMTKALLESVRAFPLCRIANCACDESGGEWQDDCVCMGHFFQMDDAYGKDAWDLRDFMDAAHRRVRK